MTPVLFLSLMLFQIKLALLFRLPLLPDGLLPLGFHFFPLELQGLLGLGPHARSLYLPSGAALPAFRICRGLFYLHLDGGTAGLPTGSGTPGRARVAFLSLPWIFSCQAFWQTAQYTGAVPQHRARPSTPSTWPEI